MSRLFASVVISAVLTLALLFGPTAGCGSSSLDTTESPDTGLSTRRDGAPVDPFDAGDFVDGGGALLADCDHYCDLVTSNCTSENAQYASKGDCLAFCNHLPPTQPTRDVEEKKAGSVACRQYWADSPAHTNPSKYCLAAGPFGGNVCGDRCTAFCDVVLSACLPDSGVAYTTQPECATACATFSYFDGGTEGGGEGPAGPDAGDTLNCRLYLLRAAVKDSAQCGALGFDSGACAGP